METKKSEEEKKGTEKKERKQSGSFDISFRWIDGCREQEV